MVLCQDLVDLPLLGFPLGVSYMDILMMHLGQDMFSLIEKIFYDGADISYLQFLIASGV